MVDNIWQEIKYQLVAPVHVGVGEHYVELTHCTLIPTVGFDGSGYAGKTRVQHWTFKMVLSIYALRDFQV